jgi:anti-sigma B factor antagonist
VEDVATEAFDRGEWAVVATRGDVDMVAAGALREQLRDLLTDGRRHIVVDLSGSHFLDSTGMGALVAGVRRLRTKGSGEGELRVVVTSPNIRRTFELTRLDRVFPIYRSLEDACR